MMIKRFKVIEPDDPVILVICFLIVAVCMITWVLCMPNKWGLVGGMCTPIPALLIFGWLFIKKSVPFDEVHNEPNKLPTTLRSGY